MQPMENLAKLKNTVLAGRDCKEVVEACYRDFLDNFNAAEATMFLNLLEMATRTPRIEEILKVIDFVRFPVKKVVERVV